MVDREMDPRLAAHGQHLVARFERGGERLLAQNVFRSRAGGGNGVLRVRRVLCRFQHGVDATQDREREDHFVVRLLVTPRSRFVTEQIKAA